MKQNGMPVVKFSMVRKYDWPAIRSRFPACSRFTYLNAAGGSPMCAEASVEGKRYFDEMLLYGDSCWDEWIERSEIVRNKLATFIGASKEEVGFSPNTSTAMGIIAHLLKDRHAVLTMDEEFPSSTIPWINQHYDVDFIKSENGTYTIKSLEKAIRPEHKILVASHVQYKTGFRQNLSDLGNFCQSANLLFVVNATQGMGVFPIDVTKNRIDFMVFSGLKWACAGYGAAGMFISRKLLQSYQIPIAGWRSVQSPELMDNRMYKLKSETSALEAGSPSFPTVFALGGALDLLTRIGRDACMNRVLFLSRLLEDSLFEQGFPVMYSFPDEHRSGIIMILTSNARTLVSELSRRGILVSARGEGLRVSVNIYNNESDINTFITALVELRSLV